MLKYIGLSIFGMLSVSASADVFYEPTPLTNSAGDFWERTSWREWKVVDPDLAGLNCRWNNKIPEPWYSPSTQLPDLKIGSWDVVMKFGKEDILISNITPAGFATIFDENSQPWLKVSLNNSDKICLVRANSKYIRPVAGR